MVVRPVSLTDPLIAPALPGLGPSPPTPFARASEPAEALREVFGFPAFRPGQREAVEAAVAGRDVLVVMPTGSGKSLCYQLPALMRADLTLVVSPLVSLDAGSGRGARAPGAGQGRPRQRPAGRRDQPQGDRPGGVRPRPAALRRARALRLARVSRPDPAGQDRPVRRRRGALRVAVGARLPARLLPARRCRALARRGGDRGLDGDRHVAGRRRHRRPPRPARSGARRDRVRPPEPVVHGRAVGDEGERAPRHRGRAVGSGGPAGDRVRRHAGGVRPAGRLGSRTSSATEVLAYHAGLPGRCAPRASGASWTARSRSSWRPTRSAWASTRPTSGRCATSRCRARSRPTTRRPGVPGATARRHAASSSRVRATRACTCSSSSARRSRSLRCKRSPAC